MTGTGAGLTVRPTGRAAAAVANRPRINVTQRANRVNRAWGTSFTLFMFPLSSEKPGRTAGTTPERRPPGLVLVFGQPTQGVGSQERVDFIDVDVVADRAVVSAGDSDDPPGLV